MERSNPSRGVQRMFIRSSLLKFGANSILNSFHFDGCTGLKITPIRLKFGGQMEETEMNNFDEEKILIRGSELDVSEPANRRTCTGKGKGAVGVRWCCRGSRDACAGARRCCRDSRCAAELQEQQGSDAGLQTHGRVGGQHGAQGRVALGAQGAGCSGGLASSG
uniref:Uncharacterized protein n=1 Tax=Rosa rugosa TaxID=74645 RepID=J7FY47_ROSRU|nr:hypothetical protein [Rosa rugosa]